MAQPIIRGIQAVGAVDIKYRYNSSDNILPIPDSIKLSSTEDAGTSIDTSSGIDIAGFRLDGEFLRANPQIASSVVIPILGGGGVSLTNNNRTGTLTINATKVSSPTPDTGAMASGTGFGPVDNTVKVYDLVTIAQIQQAQTGGGDSTGASILIAFQFSGATTVIQFDGCTVASVDPIGLSGNDAVNYNVAYNYLNWRVAYNQSTTAFLD